MSKKIGMHIGANAKAVEAARRAFMEILNSGAEQKTIRVALREFNRICAVSRVTVSNCRINVADDEPKGAA